ncbi:DUF4280 domain-containing protein [Chryseobacterium salipaludis]|uniref:PAAR-like protein n=1 Tax=Chryseobacterium TaxID=59732 RepID=UPI001FF374C7|nr:MULTISPECIES: PAAR-like protein [Chryseobacterium]MCJ8498302.1 DUF4280 domain-containing protein [Chryseobacterium salipaludis]MCX3297452.1 PAAR-like protein [Planobacterium sp. JC490]
MSKLYVPDGAWLVCSKGMKKQQIKVTSQSKITIAGGYLKATIDDRPGGNFICGKMMLIGAVVGAALAAVFIVGTIATGGALAVGAGALMAAGAAGGAAAGGLISLIPSICAMGLDKWTPYDSNVLTSGIHPLLENSTIPCILGGNVIILYSEKAADEMTDVIIGDTAIGVIGTIAFSYLMGPAIQAIGGIGASVVSISKSFGFFSAAMGNHGLGILGTGGLIYGANEVLSGIKKVAYENIPVPGTERSYGDYVDGFDTDVAQLREEGLRKPSDDSKPNQEIINDAGSAGDLGQKAVGNRTSSYSVDERITSVRLDDIEEHGPTVRTENGRITGSYEGRNPTTNSSSRILNQDFGGRYQEYERINTTTNAQYNPLRVNDAYSTSRTSMVNFAKDQWGRPQFNKDGASGGGLLLGLVQDAGKAVSNFLLERQANDVIEAMKNEEREAREKITVLAGKD